MYVCVYTIYQYKLCITMKFSFIYNLWKILKGNCKQKIAIT